MTTLTIPNATVHLARLRLAARSRQVHRDLGDAARLHTTVQSLFPDALGAAPRAATNTLFRVEREQSGASLLIQSTLPINRNALPTGYADSVEYRDLTPLLDWIEPDRIVRYRIDANPSKQVRTPGTNQRGRRTPLFGSDAIAWWEQRARQAGLHCALTLDIAQPPILASRGKAADGNNSKGVRLSAVRFEGVATVTDPDTLRAAITAGIGQGRAYGLGLLSIAPHQP